MIQSVEIKNFQSHRNTKIEFHPGVNVIRGSSRDGKSAILRALNYAINNKPAGMRHISWWAKDKKNILEECRVTLQFDDCKIARIRGDTNSYQLNDDTPMDAVESTVPEQISKAHRISEVNIQKQMDAPFLLSASSGEVSKFFNRILRLEEADEYQSAIEGKRRKGNADTKALDEQIPLVEESLKTFTWIEGAEELIALCSSLETEKGVSEATVKVLRTLITDKQELEEKLERYSIYADAEAIVKGMGALQEEYISIKQRAATLSLMCGRLEDAKEALIDKNIITEAEEVAEMVGLLQQKKARAIEERCVLENIISSHRDMSDALLEIDDAIQKLEATLPTVCPICGKELSDDDC